MRKPTNIAVFTYFFTWGMIMTFAGYWAKVTYKYAYYTKEFAYQHKKYIG